MHFYLWLNITLRYLDMQHKQEALLNSIRIIYSIRVRRRHQRASQLSLNKTGSVLLWFFFSSKPTAVVFTQYHYKIAPLVFDWVHCDSLVLRLGANGLVMHYLLPLVLISTKIFGCCRGQDKRQWSWGSPFALQDMKQERLSCQNSFVWMRDQVLRAKMRKNVSTCSSLQC